MFEGQMNVELLIACLILIAVVLLFKRLPRKVTRGLVPDSTKGVGDSLKQVVLRHSGLEATRVMSRGTDEEGWLVELVRPGGRATGLYLLLYRFRGADWTPIGADRLAEDDPKAMAAMGQGGLTALLAPCDLENVLPEAGALGPGWRLCGGGESENDAMSMALLVAATRLKGAENILAITLEGQFLAIVGTSLKLRELLKVGPATQKLITSRGVSNPAPTTANSPATDQG